MPLAGRASATVRFEWICGALVWPSDGGTLMHEIVISGGTTLDGAGAHAFTGDPAIDGERIVAVGGAGR